MLSDICIHAQFSGECQSKEENKRQGEKSEEIIKIRMRVLLL